MRGRSREGSGEWAAIRGRARNGRVVRTSLVFTIPERQEREQHVEKGSLALALSFVLLRGHTLALLLTRTSRSTSRGGSSSSGRVGGCLPKQQLPQPVLYRRAPFFPLSLLPCFSSVPFPLLEFPCESMSIPQHLRVCIVTPTLVETVENAGSEESTRTDEQHAPTAG